MTSAHTITAALGDQRRWVLPRPAAFVVASVALIAVFMSSGTPIPLYNTFRVADGITDADLALTTVLYLAATALSLLVFGRLSNQLGRRPVVIAAVTLSILGCVVLAHVHTLPVLVGGRILQGLACGIASSAAGAMVIDLAPTTRMPWLAAVITSSAPPFAIPVGALASGVLVEYATAPRTLGLTLMAVLLAGCGALLLVCPETVRRVPGTLRSLLPQVHIPTGAGRLMIAAGGTLVATWSFTGFYQAFAPGLAADYLGTTDALMIAVVFASVIVLAPLGGTLTSRLTPVHAQRIGLVVFVAGTAAIITALHSAAMVPFLVASALAGIAQGAANSGGMRGVLADITPTDRAGTLATLYLISYSGGALPGLVAGHLSRTMSLPDVGTCYAALVVVAAVVALLASRRPRRRRGELSAAGLRAAGARVRAAGRSRPPRASRRRR
ncbi:MFS transporter [Mycobacterium sp. MYCO198283]|uniref:MFS transporter n=1 Tax=Mycobacterium sp. MYCO198283 TaxID=2883505 RepID=UPI001E5A7A05|nr:MFS transporter [Mycobacterium sp. MYCO198283]MCG5431136.1 MFS transporter [Mycobacterium sp. MYCO198283]